MDWSGAVACVQPLPVVSWTNLSISPLSNEACSGEYAWFWSHVIACVRSRRAGSLTFGLAVSSALLKPLTFGVPGAAWNCGSFGGLVANG